MNDILQRIREFWKGMAPAQRMTLGAVLALVFAGLATAGMSLSQPAYVPLLPATEAGGELAAQVQEKLKELNIPFDVDDRGNILVHRENKSRIGLELLGAGVLPEGKDVYNFIFDADLTSTNQVRNERMRIATQRRLEGLIARIDAVQRAAVLITEPQQLGVVLGGKKPSKASVQVALKSGQSLTPINVMGIARMIAGAVKDLEPQDVEISDTRGQYYPVPDKNEPLQIALSRMQAEGEVQAHLKDLILETLAYVNNKRVSVRTVLDLDERSRTSRTINPEQVVAVHVRKMDESEKGTVLGGTPAPDIAIGVQNNRAAVAAGGASAGGQNTEKKHTENELDNVVSEVNETHRLKGGKIEESSVAVVVDKKEVDERKLDLEELKRLVSHAAKIPAANIEIAAIPIPDMKPTEPSSRWDEAAELFDRYGDRLLLWLLIVAGLFLLWRTVQKALPKEVTTEIERIKAEFAKAADVRPEMVVAEAAEERIIQIKTGVREMVSKNPRAVANILRKWMKS